jgi:sugar O-acyltransferase (sialic acid O-acetyltransferase NeuD family)
VHEIVFVVVAPHFARVNGHRVLSTEEFLALDVSRAFNIAVADHAARRSIATQFMAAGVEPFEVRALTALKIGPSSIGRGAILCPYTVVTADATIGAFFHANLYSYVAHDCVIGDFVTFAPNVHCNGRVVIEDDVYVGAGAIIRQGSDDRPVTIGKGAVIGMGAVVTKSVAPFTTVVGNPATPLSRP